MKKIIIRESPTIICPVDNAPHLLSKCDQCDAFDGYYEQKAKGPPIPVAVKCIVDEL